MMWCRPRLARRVPLYCHQSHYPGADSAGGGPSGKSSGALLRAGAPNIVLQPNECRAFTTISALQISFRLPNLILPVAP